VHSRKIPNGDINQLAIAPSSFYMIYAKNYTGRIEARDVGNGRTPLSAVPLLVDDLTGSCSELLPQYSHTQSTISTASARSV
jgi:hypothetical protein